MKKSNKIKPPSMECAYIHGGGKYPTFVYCNQKFSKKLVVWLRKMADYVEQEIKDKNEKK